MQRVSRHVKGRNYQTNLVLLLAARFQGVGEIAYFELSTEGKVKMILMQKRCFYFGKATNFKHFWDI